MGTGWHRHLFASVQAAIETVLGRLSKIDKRELSPWDNKKCWDVTLAFLAASLWCCSCTIEPLGDPCSEPLKILHWQRGIGHGGRASRCCGWGIACCRCATRVHGIVFACCWGFGTCGGWDTIWLGIRCLGHGHSTGLVSGAGSSDTSRFALALRGSDHGNRRWAISRPRLGRS